MSGVIAIAKITQTLHKLGLSSSLDRVETNKNNRVETNKNGRFLSFGGKIAFNNLVLFEKEA